MEIPAKDKEALILEKYRGSREAEGLAGDLERLTAGEPLAYVIGHIPFLGVKVWLDSRPLIPRPETEWWTEELIKKIHTRSELADTKETEVSTMIYHSTSPRLRVLDLCAGSGAIGLAVLKHCADTQVTFSEISNEHAQLIQKNIRVNHLDASRAAIHVGDLFTPFSTPEERGTASERLRLGQAASASRSGIKSDAHVSAMPERESSGSGRSDAVPSEQFDIIATNPPYIPETRSLSESVTLFEPKEALYAGIDGLMLIRRLVKEALAHLRTGGELWMECDISNIGEAKSLAEEAGYSQVEIRTDLYGRERLLVAQL